MENIEKNNQNELETESENINTTQDETEVSEEIVEAEDTAEVTSEEATQPEQVGEEMPEETAEEESSEYENEYEVENDDDEEDLSKVAERITRIRRSMINSTGSIRTRSPEQNRSVTNGIPVRRSAISSAPETVAEVPEEKNGKMFNIIIAGAIGLIVLVTLAIVLINVLNANQLMRPADYNITGETPADSDVTVLEPALEPTQFKVTLDFYSRKDIELATAEITLSELLESIGCRLAENEKPSVALDTVITEDMVITVDTYEYKTETVDEVIPFEVENTETDLIMRGTRETREGEEGAKTTEYSIEYVNGVEKSRTVVSETITKEPVNEQNLIGVGGEFVGEDGKTYTYSMKKIVTAKYYSLAGPTYLGFDANETVVTVMPRSLTMGTKLYVKNDNFDFGARIVADEAGGMKENEIYIWISPSNPNYSALIKSTHTDMEIYFID
ncbi:MAG: G5 domain-containing protein [Clostridia bacterium]|nr:G5 domain-containing protein [Clostridia bacterium]